MSGLVGVLIFSGSLPATRAAVMDFDPLFLTVARAAIAGVLALALLLLFREPRPSKADLSSLAIIALGVVAGFPLLSALALKHITSAHSLVFIGLLPLATALFGTLRGGNVTDRLSGCFPRRAARRWRDSPCRRVSRFHRSATA
jgi:drug/metabolite transporter (DMT)-like permease